MAHKEHRAIYAAWLSSKERMPNIDLAAFKEMTSDWEVIPVEINGDIAGAILAKGPEVHACILPKYFKKWLTPGLWRKIFVDRINRFGYIETRANTRRGKTFILRCGFVPFGDKYRHYGY